MERHKDQVLYQHPDGTPEYATDVFLDEISEETEEFLAEHGEKAAAVFYKIAGGKGTLLNAQVNTWLAEQGDRITAQTKAQHLTVVRAFTAWAGSGVLIEDVTRRYAGEFVSHLLAPTSGLSRKTARRYVSSLSSFWR
jgi:hypothetical protein